MAKKKPDKEPDGDRHHLVTTSYRFPRSALELLGRIAEAEDRTRTVILVRALKLYAQQNGHLDPADAPPG